MKKLYKAALLAAFGLGIGAAAQAQILNNDLVLGFTSPSATTFGTSPNTYQNDYSIDLGQLLGTSAHQIALNVGNLYDYNYNDSSFTADLGSAVANGQAYAGVFGATSGSIGDDLLSALTTPATLVGASLKNGAVYPSGVTLGEIAQSSSSSVHGEISTAPGLAGADPNSYGEWLPSPLETISSSQGTGGSTLDLQVYEASYTSGKSGITGTAFSDVGFVSVLFNANGGISGVAWDEEATPVPEPATCGLLGGASLLLLALRRKLTGRIA